MPGAPLVAPSDRLDPARFVPIVDTSASNGSLWVRDLLQVALLFASMPSTGRTAIVREDAPGGGATVVRPWFDGRALVSTGLDVALPRFRHADAA